MRATGRLRLRLAAAGLGCMVAVGAVGGAALGQDASNGATGAARPGGVLRIGAATEPGSLDPHKTDDTATRNVFENVYDTLLAWSPEGELVPSLATSWTTEGDTVYTFTLRDDITFHSGAPFTAEDVVFTIKRIKDPETASPWAGDFASVSTVEALDDHTVRFTLSEPFAPFLSSLARTFIGIMSATTLAGGGDPTQTVDGTGPFRYVEYVPGQRLVMERNDHYWKPGLPYLDGLEWSYYPDPTSLLNALRSGVIDWTGVVPANDVEALRSEGYQVVGGLATNFRGLYFNTEVAPFDDPRVRRAISLALGRQEIVDLAFLGVGGEPIVGSPLPPTSWAYGTFGESATADIEGARSLLAEAGHPDGLDAVLSIQTNFPFLRDPAEPIQAQLAQAGINIELRPDEFGTFFTQLQEGDFQIALFGNSGLADPDDYFFPTLHSGSPGNFPRYSDANADRLIDEGRTTLDQDARKAVYDELQTYLIDQAPIAYVYYSTQFEGMAPYVKGFEHWTNTSHLGLATTWLDR